MAIWIRYGIRLSSLPWIWSLFAAAAVAWLSGYSGRIVGSCVLFGIASIFCTAFLYSRILLHLATDDVRHAEASLHLSELRSLRRQLRSDADHRSSQLVRDLRNAYDRMRDSELLMPGGLESTLALKLQVQSLYQDSFQALMRTHVLWKTSQQMTSKEQAAELLNVRRVLLNEVGESMSNLEAGIDFLQANHLQSTGNDALSHARDELKQGLEVAHRIKDRLDQLDAEFNVHSS